MRIVSLLFVLCLVGGSAQALPNSFPFYLPGEDSSKNVVDQSALNPAPLREANRVTVRDGHFYDETGKRVRFFGVNLNQTALFPSHLDADRMAGHLHKLGVNLVRIHHMDEKTAPAGLWAVTNQCAGALELPGARARSGDGLETSLGRGSPITSHDDHRLRPVPALSAASRGAVCAQCQPHP